MHRNLPLVACLFVGVALLWHSYDPRSTAALARSDDASAEEKQDTKAKGLEKISSGTKVATIDLGAVFKVHQDFLQRTAKMKDDVKDLEERFKTRSNAV